MFGRCRFVSFSGLPWLLPSLEGSRTSHRLPEEAATPPVSVENAQNLLLAALCPGAGILLHGQQMIRTRQTLSPLKTAPRLRIPSPAEDLPGNSG